MKIKFQYIRALILFDTEKCISCGKCKRVCPMDVDVTDNSRKRKNGTECMECVKACPKRAHSLFENREGRVTVMNLIGFLFIGLAGAFLMFCGDMTLYYSKDDYINDGTLQPVIDIMKRVSTKRLYIGGIIGPLTAFLYCIGFYHLVLFARDGYEIFGWILFFINCLGIICGGAYHSHCANLGLIGRHNSECLKEVESFLDFQKKAAFGIQAVGFIGMAVMIILGWTVLPRWMFFLTPLFLTLLTPVVRKLPKGLHMIICGGWTNLISVIYYVAALICLKG